jgi:PEGA domain/Tetratricopeptide repeat
MGPVFLARVVAAAIVLCALAPREAIADGPSPADVEAARAYYRRGVELYEARRYAEALIELERAESLAPTYRLHYDMALVQRQLGDAAGALRSFRSYLEAGDVLPAARRAEVERAIAELTARVASVTVTANVPGAEIAVDDHVEGTTPLATALTLNPGSHRVRASKVGFRPETKTLEVVGGDRIDQPFSLEEMTPPAPTPPPTSTETPAAPPAPPPPSPAPPAEAPPLATSAEPPSSGERRAPTWIGWAATGALAAGAVATGIAALAESRTLSSDVEDHPSAPDVIHSAHASTVGLAAASDILTGTAVVAAGITLYATLASHRHASPPVVEVRGGPSSLWVSARF